MSIFRYTILFGAVIFSAGWMLQPALAADASTNLTLVSGTTWKSSATATSGWQEVDFDDSSWPSARAPYPNPTPPESLIPGTTAQHMWHDPAAVSDGTGGPIEAFFRLGFNLDLVSANAPVSAQALVAGDDDYDLYVNGRLVFENHDHGSGNIVDSIDFGDLLVHGSNVIAIHAVDGEWDNPYDRGYERVLFEATITSVPLVRIDVSSDGSWKSSDTLVAGWQSIEFDASGWPAARSPYPNPVAPQSLVHDTAANFIWHDPSATSDGTSGSIHAYLRREFTLTVSPDTVPVVGQARINGDDDYEFYVNGVPVHENHDGGFSSVVDTIDFTYALREGSNVLAIHAVDGSWDLPRERGAERILVDARVATGELAWNFVELAEYVDFWNCIGDPVIDGDSVLFQTRFGTCMISPHFDDVTAGLHRIDLATGDGTTIAQAGDTLPDATGVFGFGVFSAKPAQHGAQQVFHALGTDSPPTEITQFGIYSHDVPGVVQIASDDTAIPGGTGLFTDFGGWPTVYDGKVAFYGLQTAGPDVLQAGIYLGADGLLDVLVDRMTPVPQLPTASFRLFGDPDIAQRLVAFRGFGTLPDESEFSGLYAFDLDSETLVRAVDTNTLMPDTTKLFETIRSPAVAGGRIAFFGENPDPNGHEGVYVWNSDGGTLQIVADSDDATPGDPGTFLGFRNTPSMHLGNVAFEGTRVPGIVNGLYTTLGLGMSKVLDEDTYLPHIFSGGNSTFQVMNSSQGALGGNRLVFRAGIILGEASIILADDDFHYVGDADGDGIVDVADNCITSSNPAQTDSDGDGFGNTCDADLNNDCVVNVLDLGLFKLAFFGSGPDEDFNADGVVNPIDLGLLRSLFFAAPGPTALAGSCD